MDKRILYYLCLLALLTAPMACVPGGDREACTEMQAFREFARTQGDSIAIVPRRVRGEALRRMQLASDSLVKYCYLAMTLKTYLITTQLDSARAVIRQIDRFLEGQALSPGVADLASECRNMEGNVLARLGKTDSAETCFLHAYELRMQGLHREVIPDILMNLADASNRLGKLDVGAAWYRRALLMCDSLHLAPSKRTPIYYGLAQVYVSMRDFEQCDRYYNLAAVGYDRMLPYEKYIYLNNRGTSYYYREDYPTAADYFRRLISLADTYPDMGFELNLGRLNLADCYLQLGKADSAAYCIGLCRPFFERTGVGTALYYIDTQQIQLALLRNDFPEVHRLLSTSLPPPGIEPDLVHIRNRYLQLFYEETGNYREAYRYQKQNLRIDDSLRSERVRMRTADLTLRYHQDSTLMAHRVLLQEQKNEVLSLRQTRFAGLVLALMAALTTLFLYLYNKKKRALLLARNRRAISTLRLENLRNRLSPHFIFNVLNREMAGRSVEERRELSSLVRLMRHNLELAEQLSVTLAEELDFVATYIDLERRSLGPDFHSVLEVADGVSPQQTRIPSMLIQIPVENALKHALREKEGRRLLRISVVRSGDGVSIRITDNGGGFRPDSRHRGTGTGMKVVMQTIQILNGKNRVPIDASVHNVSLPDGEVGCEVAFWLPDQYDYHI